MNQIIFEILDAVANGRITQRTRLLALRLVNKEERRRDRAAARECTTASVAKAAIASVAHHEAFLAELELEREKTSHETWKKVLDRTWVDHGCRHACEACHRLRPLEPHHLVLGQRTDEPHLVMALCADCHRLGSESAHRAPRLFAQKVVVPWATAHGSPLPNRKEYRT